MLTKTLSIHLSQSCFLAVLVCALSVSAVDWPYYGGPNYNFVSPEKGWLSQWPEGGPKKLWEAKVGTGFCTFSVSNGRVYTMGNTADNDTVFCLDAETGAEKWKHSYPCKLAADNFEGGPCATPTVDGNVVYTCSRFAHVYALDATSGKEIWKKDLMQELGVKRPQWGFAGSVLVVGDKLILNVGGAGTALDKATGKVIWTSNKDAAGYATPVLATYNGKQAVVIFSAKSVVAVAVADGSKLWEREWKTSWDVNAANPIIIGDKVFVSSGYNRGCAMLQIKGSEVTTLWENKNMRNHYASCVFVDGFIYGFDGQAGGGSLKCLDAANGEVKWNKDGLKPGGLLASDGKLIALSDGGRLVVAEAAPTEYKETGSAKPLSGKCWTMPVLANGRIYARNNKEGIVVCLDVKK